MKYQIKIELHLYIHREGQRKSRENSEKKTSPRAFCMLAEHEVERLRPLMSCSTIDNYMTALRSFLKFLSETKTSGQMDNDLLKHYERWLHDHHLKPNTSSCYMRSLRSLFSKIYGEDTKSLFHQVYTGRSVTDKRSLSVEDIAQLKEVRLKPHSFLSLVRDLFLFSFYALGMPFVDMAFLRKEQISKGLITYYRHKTGQQISMRIEPCMQDIINRYQRPDSDYVFPILKSMDSQKTYGEYLLMLNRYNRALKRLATKANVNWRLTSYVARHTWASTAYSNNVELPVISKALGHANPQHTLIYIRQIDDQRLYDANHQLLRKLLI